MEKATVDLDDLMLSEFVVKDWHKFASEMSEKISDTGINTSTIPDETAYINKDGTLTICVDIPSYGVMKRTYPNGSWARKN